MVWSNSSHKKTAEDIRRLISDLEKSGLEVSIKWTPGHADIGGNCIADDLAKEAAEEAKLIPEDSQILMGGRIQEICKGILLHEMETVLGCIRYWSNLVRLQADCVVKAAYSVTMNIFRKFYFLFKSFVKVELGYVFTIKMLSTAENGMEK